MARQDKSEQPLVRFRIKKVSFFSFKFWNLSKVFCNLLRGAIRVQILKILWRTWKFFVAPKQRSHVKEQVWNHTIILRMVRLRQTNCDNFSRSKPERQVSISCQLFLNYWGPKSETGLKWMTREWREGEGRGGGKSSAKNATTHKMCKHFLQQKRSS